MNALFFRSKSLQELTLSIHENLEAYRTGSFDFITNNPDNFFETSLEIDEDKLALIDCDQANQNEIQNCILMYEGMGNVTHYLARDERLWTYLTHTLLLEYARIRWPIPEDDEEAVKHIKNHYFCIGARGIERDNASSRLWWMASLCDRANGLSLEESLTCLLLRADVRASIIERPTTSQNINIFTAVLKKLNESYKTDQKLFERARFRAIMKWLNLEGGVKLLEAMPEKRIINILENCITKAG